MRHLKTAGIISEDDVTGITEIADPVGVVCGITPTTNPTSTTIFKALIALKTRNPIVFAFHPSAQNLQLMQRKLFVMQQLLPAHRKIAYNGLKPRQWKVLQH
ncbi:bifunctional acetaldehyde-CoA/alcohol dehydrogenase [Actinobacillus equuli]|nr:bifunctional acetaldehyde-CoA/alcohol dehydrogenase [Actinobacillus equuli]